MTNDGHAVFQAKLRELINRGVTKGQLARGFGISRSLIPAYLSGDKRPRIQTALMGVEAWGWSRDEVQNWYRKDRATDTTPEAADSSILPIALTDASRLPPQTAAQHANDPAKVEEFVLARFRKIRQTHAALARLLVEFLTEITAPPPLPSAESREESRAASRPARAAGARRTGRRR